MSEGVSGDELRRAMSHLGAGVSVVAALGGPGSDIEQGQFDAMTCTSFTSLSLRPPMVMVSVRQEGSFRRHLSAAGHWVVSLLAGDQEPVARALSRPRPQRLASLPDIELRPSPVSGTPVVVGALTWLECRTERVVDAGDHTVVIGRVVATDPGERDDPALLYRRRRYLTG
ncbi:flavin reductase [Auraticoccus sp. F435]|uniref:Flavin reductase n=1 Tax=Auraticoccus cholistanensis TaxID=2656650 RepID=A0A6A9UXW0_9ACTN|nr:flavin reductase [Auraticoccus cholistanensis]